MADEFVVNFPVLWVAVDWIEQHCVIPDGFKQGEPFVLPPWQAWFFANHYRIKPEANLLDDDGGLLPARGASAFQYRRSQVIMPQKIGKGPMSAAQVCLEGVGPALFAGWAKGGERYRCSDNGCGCGWVYEYEPGEPMGALWPTPLIQVTAFSEEQTGNVFDALRPMILKGPLVDVVPRVTEDFIRLPGGGRIDAVTSSAQSRLGQRVTFVLQDEALALDTPLPTPSGWTTMGAVAVGEWLLGADGHPVRVVKTTEVQHGRTCYRVGFKDGTSIVASDGHLWQTKAGVLSTGAMVALGAQGWSIPARAGGWEAIVSIEPVESVPVRCVGVDSEDHLFLAGEGGHVTHNTQLWTEVTKMVKVATTQRRGAAGMDGRVVETTNAYDPAENSVAQQTAEANMPDVFRLHRQAPHRLVYTNKADRRRIHAAVYAGSPWVNLDSIEGEAAELIAKGDPAQAERFFGNRIVAGTGQWMPDELWAEREDAERLVPEGSEVCGGFDGSKWDDFTAIRLETHDGFRFTPTYGPDRRPAVWNPKEWGGEVPTGEVHAAWSELSKRYKLVRVYCDPPYWDSEIGDWSQLYGEEVFVEWATYRVRPMHDALERSIVDLRTGRSTHDACPITKTHMMNTRKVAKPGELYLIGKPAKHQKIDAAMADTLAHEAASDARADGWMPGATRRVFVFRK